MAEAYRYARTKKLLGQVLNRVLMWHGRGQRPTRSSVPHPRRPVVTGGQDAATRLPVIAAEGPLAGAAAGRVADQLATLAGLPVTSFRLPDQRVAARTVLAGPLAPAAGQDDFFRDRTDDTGRRLRLLVRCKGSAWCSPGEVEARNGAR